jgi:hypothetical protein
MRRERPHPLTHRASRLPWGRSRLSHAQRVTRLAASQSRSCKTTFITNCKWIRKVLEIIKAPARQLSRHLQARRNKRKGRFGLGLKAEFRVGLNLPMHCC